MKKFDLTWGDSVAVRQAFIEQTHGIPIQFGLKELSEMDYTPFYGDAKLIEETAKVILRQTGQTYKHIFLTNGASGGCTIALRAYQAIGGLYGAVTNPAPYFPLYPAMIRAAGIARHHTTEEEYKSGRGWKHVVLLDSPNNPAGRHVGVPEFAKLSPVIWDTVYHTWSYCHILPEAPKHDVAVGSFSKLTGLNGLRLGWIATNNDYVAPIIGELIAPEYCGLSKPSKMILLSMLDQFNNDPEYHWGAFEHASRYALDLNREQWAKLEKFFDGTLVPVNGMFYYAGMDDSAKALFEKAGVHYQVGSKCGTTDDFGRFNIGQDPKVVLAAVKAVLKTDKI